PMPKYAFNSLSVQYTNVSFNAKTQGRKAAQRFFMQLPFATRCERGRTSPEPSPTGCAFASNCASLDDLRHARQVEVAARLDAPVAAQPDSRHIRARRAVAHRHIEADMRVAAAQFGGAHFQ